MFNLVSICRPIGGLSGFSGETVIEVTTDIESQEFCRQQNQEIGYVENPSASETDDLKCFYGMCLTWLGPYFTPEEFTLKWRKILWYVHLFCLFLQMTVNKIVVINVQCWIL